MDRSTANGRSASVLERAQELAPSLVELRRDIHRRPELGFEEVNTRAAARVLTERSGWTVRGDGNETGLIASLGDRPVVLLRACLDALPIDDPKSVPYRSSIPGVAHACGHDAQVAVLVGAALLLAEVEPDAPVAVLFQPAEEIDTGATSVLNSGALEGMPLRSVLGFHGHPALPAGTVGICPGPIMACITTVKATISGRGGHGAEPQHANDTIGALAALVNDWQVAIGRRIDGRQGVVLSMGRIAAGRTPNVIPGEAVLEGTLRYLDPRLRDELVATLTETARSVELRFGTTIDLHLDEVVPALVNDAGVTADVEAAAQEVLGPGAVVPAVPSLGGDDFAFLAARIPGCYFFLGEGQPGRAPYGWHDPAYDLDERAIPLGSAVLAQAALRAAQRSRP